MKILDIFSWLPAREMSLEQIESIYKNCISGSGELMYRVETSLPENVDKRILSVTEELRDEEKQVAYLIRNDNIIAVIGYR